MELGNQTLSDPHTVSCMTIWLVRDLTHFSAGTPRKTRGDVVPGGKSEETWMFLYNRCQILHQKMGEMFLPEVIALGAGIVQKLIL